MLTIYIFDKKYNTLIVRLLIIYMIKFIIHLITVYLLSPEIDQELIKILRKL